ncbi:hypothetical protein EDB84DRAFT_1438552 [Lactarius hengduanensis]|nr:hypothetical protein EDB84DRAFT_1438552 [Lactarius hengduanensis]
MATWYCMHHLRPDGRLSVLAPLLPIATNTACTCKTPHVGYVMMAERTPPIPPTLRNVTLIHVLYMSARGRFRTPKALLPSSPIVLTNKDNTSTIEYASSDTCVYVVPEKTLDAFRGALAVGDWTYSPSSYFPNNDNVPLNTKLLYSHLLFRRLNRARVSWFCGIKQRAIGWPQGGSTVCGGYYSREEFSGAAGYEAPLGLVRTSRVSPGVDSLNCRRKGSEGKRTQGESVEIWVGKASSKVVVLPASGPEQTTLDETAYTRQMFSVPELQYLQTPSMSFYTDETCGPKICNSAMRIAIASQGTLRDFTWHKRKPIHSPTRVVPDANGGKEEEEGSVLGAVPRHAPDSTGRSAQSAAGAGL